MQGAVLNAFKQSFFPGGVDTKSTGAFKTHQNAGVDFVAEITGIDKYVKLMINGNDVLNP